jgi:hypothetical protein
MRDIVDLAVTQVRVYPTDSLPFAELRRPDSTKRLKETFRFENIQLDPLNVQLTFTNGTFEHRGKSIHVLSLTVEQRRVVIQLRGRSPMADAFYSAFASLLQTLAGRSKSSKALEPLLKVEETSCVAVLDIDFDDLIALPLLRFLQTEGVSKLRTKYGAPKSINFKSLSFEVRYASAPQLEEHDVTLSNKLITIEPRLATPLREKCFYTTSPTDSETHISILETLEKEVAKHHAGKK